MRSSKLAGDTLLLSAVSLALQGLGLLLNIAVSHFLGAAAIGVMSLIFSFFAYATTLGGGNIFTSTGRFVSEEIGKGGNPDRIMRYAVTLALSLSSVYSAAFFIFSGRISEDFLNSPGHTAAIRILALSLPLATLGNCIKGYFHARRIVKIPAAADCLEFSVKAGSLLIGVLMSGGGCDIFTVVSVGICMGEISSCSFLAVKYFLLGRREPRPINPPTIKSYRSFLLAVLPIAANGYIFVLLCSANEALIPLTLKSYAGSAEEALSQYGTLEGIIMPVLYFPAVILQSLSMILTPEIARHKSAGNNISVGYIAAKAIRRASAWAFFAMSFMLVCGSEIGLHICGSTVAARAIPLLCPVMPFIYLEGICGSVLCGIGRQNFCTAVSVGEYAIRIAAMLLLVPRFGFYGIIGAYYASNCLSNTARVIAVIKYCKTGFSPISFISDVLLIPGICCLIAWQCGRLFSGIILSGVSVGEIFEIVLYGAVSCGFFIAAYALSVRAYRSLR